MKTEKKYTKLTHEEALKLLQENNWSVEGVVYTDGALEPEPDEGPDSPLVGIGGGIFLSESDMTWDNCFKIEEANVFEVGDRVKVSDCSCAAVEVGWTGIISEIDEAGDVWINFDNGETSQCFHPDDLEPAPEPDPFEEWYEKETNLAGKHKRLARLAFEAGREYERSQSND